MVDEVSLSVGRLKPDGRRPLADCRDNAWIASGATASEQVQLELFHRTRDCLEAAFDILKKANAHEEPTPIFGKVDVVFSRSGMCKLSMDPASHPAWPVLRPAGSTRIRSPS
jgi:hypothetical protein